jgi:dTDP-4-dehydrorhamnose 3,5-epimerase-like enzyme
MVDARATENLPRGCKLLSLGTLSDERGKLVVVEGARQVPFDIARVYCVIATPPGAVRGRHAHRTLTQVAVAVAGACTMSLDDGSSRSEVRLDDPATGLLLPPLVWHEMSDFTDDCVLMVLAEDHYNEADYIRDYEEFVGMAGAAR